MRDYQYIINSIYTNLTHYQQARVQSRGQHSLRNSTEFMEIAMKKDTIEIPTFVLMSLNKLNSRCSENFTLESSLDAIVAKLCKSSLRSGYKSLERAMQDNILELPTEGRLIEIEAKMGQDKILYYVTHGLIMDVNLHPVMMCSWIVDRKLKENGTTEYKCVQPVLRVDPNIFIYKEDEMGKFIVNKMIKNCLEYKVYSPRLTDILNCFDTTDNKNKQIKVEIFPDSSSIVHPAVPTILTTNEELIQAALDNLEDIQYEYC